MCPPEEEQTDSARPERSTDGHADDSAAEQTDAIDEHASAGTESPTPTHPDRRRRRSKLVVIGIPAASVVVILALITALGGFQQRHDRIISVEPGTVMDTGPFQITWKSATVQSSKRYKPNGGEVVSVTGKVKNTWTEAHQPREDQFAAQDADGATSVKAMLVRFGGSGTRPATVTPGLPAISITVEFSFPKKTEFPGGKVRVATRKLSYGQHYFLQSGNDKTWSNGDKGFTTLIRLKRLPAAER